MLSDAKHLKTSKNRYTSDLLRMVMGVSVLISKLHWLLARKFECPHNLSSVGLNLSGLIP